MGHPYRQRHENGDFDKQAKTATNTGKVTGLGKAAAKASTNFKGVKTNK